MGSKNPKQVLAIDPGVTTGLVEYDREEGLIRSWVIVDDLEQVVMEVLGTDCDVVVVEDFVGSRKLCLEAKYTIMTLGAVVATAKLATGRPAIVQSPSILERARVRWPEVERETTNDHERSACYHARHAFVTCLR